MSTIGKVRALGADAGTVLWESEDGKPAWMAEQKEKCLSSATKLTIGNEMEVGLDIIEGALVVSDYGEGIVGIDTATGAKLWSRGGVRYRSAIPTAYRTGGREYIAVGNRLDSQSVTAAFLA